MKLYEHGGNVYEPCAGEWLDFSANINPLGLPEEVREAVVNALDHLVHYPDSKAGALKDALSEHYQVPAEQMVLGNGAAELIYLVCYQLRPRRVLLLSPTFSEYEKAARAAEADIVYHDLSAEDNFALDEISFIEKLDDVDIAVLANPNNPTGNLIEKEVLLRILEAAEEKGVYLMVDESFLDFLPTPEMYSMRSRCSSHSRLIILQSMTKFYAIPGLRLGFGVFSEALAARLEQGKDVWNVNHLAQVAGVAAVRARGYQEATRRWLKDAAGEFQRDLSELQGLYVYPSAVNFLLLRIEEEESPTSAGGLLRKLKEQGILLRDCSNYRGLDERFLRTAVRSSEENHRLLQAIGTIWREEQK
ncbi:threonine-phosphate decarboxylase CobD [Selenomonas sp. TAMA-11512]|uniref:threonine-phosphate decarboxylase CobD n=1 Tax=Selenomonas sp. TAMA-11512 TaxID=3095337 RepID=UPI003090DA01|nr:threonine-phosphate decarboxylase CobD [Selenomonas sp. TAMA-11512]